ncbi:MAG TPA: sigma-70 family RNA polymerase sigma factor [Labilithrix sp.]|nr:sigma-70 family RNA polymerase sigma factor [Labilithrix sp.]
MEPYARYRGALLRKAQRLLGNRADAQDVVQSLFVDLYAKGEAPELPYLYRAVTNRCLSLLRDESNRTRLLEAHDDLFRGPVRTRCDDRVIDLDMLMKLAQSLDERHLQVLCYRYFDDMSHEEVASMIGLSRKTVQKIVDDIHRTVTELAS